MSICNEKQLNHAGPLSEWGMRVGAAVLISTDHRAKGPGREPQSHGLCGGGIFAGREQPEPGGRVPWGMCVCTQHAAGDVGGVKKEKEREEGKRARSMALFGSRW